MNLPLHPWPVVPHLSFAAFLIVIVFSLHTSVGHAAVTATGDVSPTPPVSGSSVAIGVNGIGSLTIDGGSEFASTSITLGGNDRGFGKAMVTGPGSRWTVTSGIVGQVGFGQLEIHSGGTVEVTGGGQFHVGGPSQGDGIVVVDGTDSLLHVQTDLEIGGFSHSSGVLRIGAGGMVNVPANFTRVNPDGRLEMRGGFLRTRYLEPSGLLSGWGEIQVLSNSGGGFFARTEVGADEHLLINTTNSEVHHYGEITVAGGELEFSSGL